MNLARPLAHAAAVLVAVDYVRGRRQALVDRDWIASLDTHVQQLEADLAARVHSAGPSTMS